MLQPDVGQTGLLLSLWGALLFFAGLPLFWVGLLAGVTARAGRAAYIFPHVHHRVEQYLSDADDIGYQAGLALKAFAHGGFAGVGPGAGTVKYRIPDAHSDFIFAVAGEEFGLVLCGIIAVLFCLLTVRLLLRAAVRAIPSASWRARAWRWSTAVQAFINMGVAIVPSAGQGHDAALHLLWRLVALRHRADDGLCAGGDAAAAQDRRARRNHLLRRAGRCSA